ncbi:MAG: N-acetyltransferase [Victivallales bacterium]|nr:N-acetyltransferase [Victivallales bacterium]
MKKEILIRQERPEDYRKSEELVRESFWNVYRPGCLEHYVVHEFRNRPEYCPELAPLMFSGGELIGQAMFVKNTLRTTTGVTLPILTLGPICIHPRQQRKGYGKLLLDHALSLAAATEAVGVFMEGNINFYGKCGFVMASTMNIHYMDESDDVPYFLGKALKPKALHGIEAWYRIPEGYLVDEKQAEEFDKQFPPKQKLRLPGQLA